MRRVALLASVALIAAGCSSESGPTAKILPPPALAAGWTEYTSKDDHFSMGMPPGWAAVDKTSPESIASLDKITKVKPQMLPQIKMALSSPDMAMTAMDINSFAGQYVISANVTHKTGLTFTPLDSHAVASYRQGLEQELPPKSQLKSVEVITLPIGKAILSRWYLEAPTPGGVRNVSSLSYFVPNNTESFVATFSCLASEESKLAPLFEQMANSLRVTQHADSANGG